LGCGAGQSLGGILYLALDKIPSNWASPIYDFKGKAFPLTILSSILETSKVNFIKFTGHLTAASININIEIVIEQ
jgi:hypothetical protein